LDSGKAAKEGVFRILLTTNNVFNFVIKLTVKLDTTTKVFTEKTELDC
jgi:hypothetical protein